MTFFATVFHTFSLKLQRAAIRACGSNRCPRIRSCPVGVAPSNISRWNSLLYGYQDNLRRPRRSVSQHNQHHSPMLTYKPPLCSYPYEKRDQFMHASCSRSHHFRVTLGRSNSPCRIDKRNQTTLNEDLFTSSFRELAERVMSTNRFTPKDKSACPCVYRRNGIRQTHVTL